MARLAAVIRVRFGSREEMHRSDYHLDEMARTVAVAGGPAMRLTAGEYRLFPMLFAARNRPVARERLEESRCHTPIWTARMRWMRL